MICADMLTKPLARVKLNDLMARSGMFLPRADAIDRKRRPKVGLPRDTKPRGD